jgi:hypothetical protein
VEQLSLLMTAEPDDATCVWDTLDEEQRAKIVGMLARLMAKIILAATQQEPNDE